MAEVAVAGPSGGGSEKKRFEIKKWTAIAMWSWAICTDTCAICRNNLYEPSIEYQANPTGDPDHPGLSIAWGTCGHVFPPGLHPALAQDTLGVPAVQQGVGVLQDREDSSGIGHSGRRRVTAASLHLLASLQVSEQPQQQAQLVCSASRTPCAPCSNRGRWDVHMMFIYWRVSVPSLLRRRLAAGHHQRNRVAIQQDRIKLGLDAPLWRDVVLRDVLQHHVDVCVEPAQRADDLLLALEQHPDLGAHALVDELA
eukprot:CAMPEP_0119164500 /NCGR_PEP_ID=MMETSP1315-20130426/4358_1 /TAXON_ID=676789 /ORGANISM="Prasinoderma singularis, Strain RCC927" /LENGTH=253 /DNA_ID=CAMNT_0007157671 /DNA_START=168 /DNA_END=926 /DNA_ORIENTATION=-